MEIKIIQIRNNNGMWICLQPNDKPIIVDCGYIVADEFDEDYCWDLCNWSHWRRNEGKPENLHSELANCNSDVAFLNPETNKWFVATSFGWDERNTKEDAIRSLVTAPR